MICQPSLQTIISRQVPLLKENVIITAPTIKYKKWLREMGDRREGVKREWRVKGEEKLWGEYESE